MIDDRIKKIDLHMHTTISDGTDSLSEILVAVKNAGIDLFSVTDHDAIRGGIEMPALLRGSTPSSVPSGSPSSVQSGNPSFIRGVEFSCKDEDGKYHILGYGYDPDVGGIASVVKKGHGFRMEKTKARLDYLKDEFGFDFSAEDIETLMNRDNPGKPHIGNLMVQYGYAETKEIAIKEFINKKRFPSLYVRPEEAIEGILSSGGIPILAHPTYGSGEELIMGEEMRARLLKLMDFGLKGVEAFYSGFTQKMILEMLTLAEDYDLYVTAGSDYHGKNKLIPLGDNNLDDLSLAPFGLRRFLQDVRTT